MNYAAMGARIKVRRKEMHMTQGELAAEVGISPAFMGHIERGTRVASLETLCGLCGALRVTANYLLGIAEDGTETAIFSDLTRYEIEAAIKVLGRLIEMKKSSC